MNRRPRLGTIDRALDELRTGRVVVIPTETVYGLVGPARRPGVATQLDRIKGQRGGKAYPVLVGSVEMARALADTWPDAATTLARALWPGGLTMVLDASADLERDLLAGGTTVGVRMPDHPVALEIIEGLGEPLASTSANRSGSAPPTSAGAATRALGGEDLIVVDGGTCRSGRASTVVSLANPDQPALLREGAIPRMRIEEILGATLG